METFIYSGKIPETMCDQLVQFYKNNPDRQAPDKYREKTSNEIVLTRDDNIYKEYNNHLDKVLQKYLKIYEYANNTVRLKYPNYKNSIL